MGVWQGSRGNLSLKTELLRQVRIAIERDPARVYLEDGLDRGLKVFEGLAGQPVKEIHIHGCKTESLGLLHQHQGVVRILDAVDGQLDRAVEILYSKAHPVESQCKKMGETIRIDGSGIDLDPKLPVRTLIQSEGFPDGSHQGLEFGIRKVGWGASSQVKLAHHAIAADLGTLKSDLLVQLIEV
ncbi:hypothetical protein B2A_11479 [mine drainage metagenome]|uniref:Uncharacterized protein n=1 Tax=mine drainage metagenome TaxID=410659 RepID=T0Z2A0_9ZZZZ